MTEVLNKSLFSRVFAIFYTSWPVDTGCSLGGSGVTRKPVTIMGCPHWEEDREWPIG